MPNLLLEVQQIYKEFSGEKLFSPLSFTLRSGDKIAVIGDNGVGKSTLIKMILKQVEQTSGNIIYYKEYSIGYLSQDIIENENVTAYEELESNFNDVLNLDRKIKALYEKMETNYSEKDLDELSKLETRFNELDGYSYQYKIDKMLNMFSISNEDKSRVISSFSGGEKVRLAFAKLLLKNPDILILDEPTNHLDIISIEWLEDYLKDYSGGIIFVSHDALFIDKLANKIIDIDNKEATFYNTNYENFKKEKRDYLKAQLLKYNLQEQEREKLQRFITYYMPKPRFTSRAQDRVKKLERLNENSIDKPIEKKKKINVKLKGDTREGKKLIEFVDVSFGYDKPLINNVNFLLQGKDRLAIMGANGVGKTTFSKIVLNELEPISGKVNRYFDISIGVLLQNIRSFQSNETLFTYISDLYPKMNPTQIYSSLANYGFTYKEANEKKINQLSGGELMRVEILNLSLRDYDLLILDEPTNHLDINSISTLIDAINQYQGTLLIISHDRDFISKTCNKILYFYNHNSYYYEGSYFDFKDNQLNKIIKDEEDKLQLEKENMKSKVALNVKPTNPKISKQHQTRISSDKLIEKIEKLENQKKQLEDSINLVENYSNIEKLNQIGISIKDLDNQIQALYIELEKTL